jgi:AcrR family transcriptional regulator
VAARILDAAQAEFMQAGYEAASTNRITTAFGGSKATLFRHFPTKLLLLEGVLRRIASRWREKIHWTQLDTDSPREWLTGFVVQTLHWILAEDVLFVGRIGISEGHKITSLEHIFVELASEPLEVALAKQLSRWTELGYVQCPEAAKDAAHFMDLAIAGAVSRALYGRAPLSDDAIQRHAGEVVDLFLVGRGVTP